MRAMFVLTFSPLGEKVNTIMVLIHQPVKKSTLGKIVKNCPKLSGSGIAETPHNEMKCILSTIGSYSIEKKWVKIYIYAYGQGRGG